MTGHGVTMALLRAPRKLHMLCWIGAVSGQQIAPASRYLTGRDLPTAPWDNMGARVRGRSVLKESGRLLVVTESLGIGGTETHLFRLLPSLAAAGWEITTFCLTGRGKRAPSLRRQEYESLLHLKSAGRRRGFPFSHSDGREICFALQTWQDTGDPPSPISIYRVHICWARPPP